MRALLAIALALFLSSFAASQELHVNDSGTWRKATEVHVNDAGTWRNIQEIWVNDGGTWRKVFSSALLTTTITVGDDGVIVFYGYNSGLFGSIGTATYTDRDSNSRTISAVLFDASASGFVRFLLNAPSIPNTDATFSTIVIHGVSFSRSAATYDGSFGGGTRSSWLWSAVDSSSVPTSGTITFAVQ